VDPLEAVAGGWQAGTHVGAELVNQPGTVVWNELATTDLDDAVAFYSAILPVTGHAVGEESFRYQTLQVDGRDVCGVYEASGVPPHWVVYFAVEDVDSTVYRAIALGGSVTRAATDSPFGRQATLTDSQGAAFSVITPPPAQPGLD
jgi:uncharacterized protein